jgi:hypothetical protein
MRHERTGASRTTGGRMLRLALLLLVLATLIGTSPGQVVARPKRLAAGLMTVGNTGELPSIIDVWVPYLDWAELQPSRGRFRFKPIDDLIHRARASGDTLRLRIFAGRAAPDWVKRRFGTVMIHDPIDGVSASVPRWWVPGYMDAYKRFQARLAHRYDGNPTVRSVTISGAMTVYAEQFIRGIGSSATRTNLLRAGYRSWKDRRAIRHSITAHTPWHRTRQIMAFNPWQFVRADGTVGISASFSTRMMDRFRSVFGRRAILHNCSIRSSYITNGMPPGYETIYRHMRALGGPITFQTARTSRVGDLDLVLEWSLRQGAHGVELHKGAANQLSTDRARFYDAKLEAKA